MPRIKFKHEKLELQELEVEQSNNARWYLTPEGNKYPSVSTAIGWHNRGAIAEWRKRVGKAEATKVTTKAAAHGTKVHKICEHYLDNAPDYKKDINPVNLEAFNKIKKVVDPMVKIVYGLEIPLYSDYLQVGGRCDLACKFGNTNTIVDFKTSAKIKKIEWITNYFEQAACYAVMAEERTGVCFPQIAIIIANSESNQAQLFVQKRDNYVESAKEKILSYIDAHKEQAA